MLTHEQIAQYQGEGFTIYREFVKNRELSLLLSDIEAISAGNTLADHDKSRLEMEPRQAPDGTRVRRIYEPCTHYARFRALSEAEKLLDCVEQLIGPDLVFHYSKINMKPPAIGSVVEWHQDLAYYPLTNRDAISILVYLDDASATNGCLKVIPRLHLGSLLNHTHDGFFQGRVTEPVDESTSVLLEGKAGDVIFMHCMTPHASTTNTSIYARRTLILGYRAADAFPIYIGEKTVASEVYARHVRGQQLNVARFSMKEFPIPKQQRTTSSLYELQELSREEIAP